MDLGLKGKVAIVTGGGWGIGKATAACFAEEGSRVVIADIDAERGGLAAEEMKSRGCEVVFERVDVSKWDEVKACSDNAIKRFGQVDIVVNNAGLWRTEFFVKQPREDWAQQVDVCFYGTLNFCKALIEHMVLRKSGAIVNVGSDAARVGEPNQPLYSGAKAAVVAFSKALAKEVGRHGIRVNVVCPSMTVGERRIEMEEEMKAKDPEKYAAYQDQMKKIQRLYPLGKLGKPEDVASMIVFLSSDRRAGHITGQTISVNGGYVMI